MRLGLQETTRLILGLLLISSWQVDREASDRIRTQSQVGDQADGTTLRHSKGFGNTVTWAQAVFVV
jgi:hypothetical protein